MEGRTKRSSAPSKAGVSSTKPAIINLSPNPNFSSRPENSSAIRPSPKITNRAPGNFSSTAGAASIRQRWPFSGESRPKFPTRNSSGETPMFSRTSSRSREDKKYREVSTPLFTTTTFPGGKPSRSTAKSRTVFETATILSARLPVRRSNVSS